MGYQLFAIKQALLYIKEKYFGKSVDNFAGRAPIYTESLSSIQINKNSCPRNYIYLIFSMHNVLSTMIDEIIIIIQFIPCHKNIKGNEMVDLTANATHCNEIILMVSLSYNEIVRSIRNAVVHLWQTNGYYH